MRFSEDAHGSRGIRAAWKGHSLAEGGNASFRFARKAVSQETCPSRTELALSRKECSSSSSTLPGGAFLFHWITNRLGRCRAAVAVLAPVLVLGLKQAPAPEAARTEIDEAGRRVALRAEVHRVVSLAPNVTETLYALGVDDKIVGITDFTELPPGAPAKPTVGEPVSPNLERIAALRPDLVFAAETINRRETVEALDRLGIPVYTTNPRTVEETLASIRHIAALVGTGAAGEELASRLQARLDAVRTRLAGRPLKRVLFVVWEDPLITTGQNTFVADTLRWAGAESIINLPEDWPHVSLEEVVRLQPDDLIFPATQTGSGQDIARGLEKRPGWRDLDAVRDGRVLVVSDAINRPSPALVDAIEELARELHPAAYAGAASQPPESLTSPRREMQR
jgi:iron complex transport system substrate-binding protein